MAHGIAQIHVRTSRGKLIVQAMGQTGRGQSYLKEAVELTAKTPADPNFKSELAAAVTKIDTVPEPSG